MEMQIDHLREQMKASVENNAPIKLEELNEEIDFDQLLGDAARSQALYDEDRDDDQQFSDDDGEENIQTNTMDSLSLSKTDISAMAVKPANSSPKIERHGLLNNFHQRGNRRNQISRRREKAATGVSRRQSLCVQLAYASN